jgi:GDP-4-dehydro-6-deoxy-D-mannose reductase
VIPARILVTGAEGFVGSHLSAALAAAFPDAAITGTGLNRGPGLRLDITDRDAVFAAFAALHPDICIHLAGITAIGAALSEPDLAWAVNLQGTLNVADAILAQAPSCRLMFISTAEVYGTSFHSGHALDETAGLNPMNLYAATKAAAELALGAMTAQGLRLLRLRPFNHTGPGQSEAFVVPAFAGQIARIEAGIAPPVLQVGALHTERDFMDVRDVCAAYIACMRRIETIPNNDIINLASGRAHRIGDILKRLLALARCPITVAEDPAKLRKTEIRRAVGDADYAAQILGWEPVIDLDDTLTAVLDAARSKVARLVSLDRSEF